MGRPQKYAALYSVLMLHELYAMVQNIKACIILFNRKTVEIWFCFGAQKSSV